MWVCVRVCVNIGIDESPHKHVLPVSCKMASSASTSTMEDDRGEVSRLRPLFPFFFPSVSGDDDEDDGDDDEEGILSHSHAPSPLPSSLHPQDLLFLSLPTRPFLQFPLPSLASPNPPLMTHPSTLSLFSLPFSRSTVFLSPLQVASASPWAACLQSPEIGLEHMVHESSMEARFVQISL